MVCKIYILVIHLYLLVASLLGRFAQERERKEALKTTFLTIEGENLIGTFKEPGGSSSGDDTLAFGVTMPALLNQFLSRNLGAPLIINQTLLDLLSLVENNRDIPEGE